MLIGYARTSTFEQDAGLEAQLRDLQAAGCEKVYQEKISSVATREKLDAALEDLRAGDVFIVTKLDRLARSMRDLINIVDAVKGKGASLRILNMNLDTNDPTGKLMLNVIGSIAEFERDIMLQRQKEGIQKAKAEGKYKGRQPTARAKLFMIRELAEKGLGATEISRRLNVGRASVYRVLKEGEAKQGE